MTHTTRFTSGGFVPVRTIMTLAAVLAVLMLALPVQAKNHLWRFHEFYSNASGTIQFIEMRVCCPSSEEVQLSGADIATDSNFYTFPNDLVGDTSDAQVLIATAGFAALSGAPTPDYIIPDNFFNPAGDTFRYRFSFDVITIGPGVLPTDGVTSLERLWPSLTLTPIVNSPTNFAGVSGSVALPAVVTAAPLLVLGATLAAGSLALARRRRSDRPD